MVMNALKKLVIYRTMDWIFQPKVHDLVKNISIITSVTKPHNVEIIKIIFNQLIRMVGMLNGC